MSDKHQKNYSEFNNLLFPVLVINDEYSVVFLNDAAKREYGFDKDNLDNINADHLNPSVDIINKCYKISHQLDKPCYEFGIDCPIKELIKNKDENKAVAVHNHHGKNYKVEAYRDRKYRSMFLEWHNNISDYISMLDIFKKAKDFAESSEKRLQTFFDNLPSISFILDVETGFFIDVNKKAVEFYGYTKEEFIKSNITLINPFISIEETISFRSKALTEGSNFTIFKHRLKNGDVRDVEVAISAVTYNGKNYIQFIINDITEKKILEEKVRESLKAQDKLAKFNILLGEANRTIAHSQDEQSLLREICNLSIRYTAVRLVWVGKPNKDGDFEVLAKAGDIGYLDKINVSIFEDTPEGRGAIGQVWRRKTPIFNFDFIKEAKVEQWLENAKFHNIKTSSAIPIFHNGELYANFIFYGGSGETFDATAQSILIQLANDIGFGLDKIENERKRRELQIINEALLNNAGSGIITTKYPERIIEGCNETFAKMFGYSKEEIIGQSTKILYDSEEDFKKVKKEIYNKSLEGEPHTILRDIKFRTKTGNIFFADIDHKYLKGLDRFIGTFYDVTERYDLEQELALQALYDKLTSIPNRRHFESELEKAAYRANRKGYNIAIAILDLDDFKPINDTYGHEAGDMVLKTIAERVKYLLRKNDFFARFGGDEFVIIIEDIDKKELETILKKIEKAVTGKIYLDGHVLSVGLSMGIRICNLCDEKIDSSKPSSILRLADIALYRSKANKYARSRYYEYYEDDKK